MHSSKATRFHYLDHVRGSVIALVVLQHGVQTYAQNWGGRFYFIQESDRSAFMDGLFMYTDSFIMQALFFLAGIFVLPSLRRRGWISFLHEKTIRLGAPFALGVAILVPPLTYPKYFLTTPEPVGYFAYWTSLFFTDAFQTAGFWFLSVLFAFSIIIGVVHTGLPFLTKALGSMTRWAAHRPLAGFLLVAFLGAILIGLSDLAWGAPWWKTLWWVFSARKNMFFSYVLYFLLGVGVYRSGVLEDDHFLKRLGAHWMFWGALTALFALAYTVYSVEWYYDGAFSNEIRHFFYQGGQWEDAWPLIVSEAPGVLIRTTLHGFLIAAQVVFMVAVFYRFTKGATPFWTPLAACSYGIYVLHEPLVVWTQYAFLDTGAPIILKCVFSTFVGLFVSWGLTDRVLRRLPGVKRVF